MKRTIFLCMSLLCLSLLFSCGSDDNGNEEVVVVDPDPNPDPDPGPDTTAQKPACESGKKTVFIEKEGILVIEMESVAKTGPWKYTNEISDFSGDGYLINETDYLKDPGNGTLTYFARITNPGTYRFLWRSRISKGTSNTDLNDNWLRIPDAKHFFGRKDATEATIVYPNGSIQQPLPDSTEYSTIPLEGNSKNGWFKIYMNSLNGWTWKSCTSDNDPHFIYAVFDTAGDYTIEISARSEGHAIDKFVLFKEDVAQNIATDPAIQTSAILCE